MSAATPVPRTIHTGRSKTLALIVALAALGAIAPAAASAKFDLNPPQTTPRVTHATDPRSPDARDANLAALAAQSSTDASRVDPRSPDARDAAARAVAASAQTYSIVDGRSPDTRDVARGVKLGAAPSPAATVSHVSSNSFQWGDVGLGAAFVLALLIVVGGMTLLYRRRHDPGARLAG
jgi:hypothetical protein